MNSKIKILFVASHRKDRAPNQRFRFEQYINFLEQNNFECKLSNIVSEKDDQYLYKQGYYIKKFLFTIKSSLIRYRDYKSANNYDIIFICREALMTGSVFFEKAVKKTKAKIIYDFDDSIWLQNVSDANKWFAWMKNPGKTAQIIELSDLIFAGNEYLSNFASRINSSVLIIPTTIDTEEYKRENNGDDKQICIGWSGSITTIQHFKIAIPFLAKIKQKYGEKVSFKVIGDANYINEDLEIKGIGWSKKDEIKELSKIDIGIMPLPNDEWAKGKCGLKGLQYMALEIPTIMSPVGVNKNIISDGVNGYLADSENEWVEKLSQLIESEILRKEIGNAARNTVVERYSVESQKINYLNSFNELLSK